MVTEIGGVWAAATHVRPDVMRQARAQSVTALSFSAQFALRHPTLRPHLVPPTLSFTPSYKPFPPSCTQWSMYRRSPPVQTVSPQVSPPYPSTTVSPVKVSTEKRVPGPWSCGWRDGWLVAGCRVPSINLLEQGIDRGLGVVTSPASSACATSGPRRAALQVSLSAAFCSGTSRDQCYRFSDLGSGRNRLSAFFSPLILRQSIVQYPAVPTRRSKQWNSKSFVYLLFPLVTCTLSRSMEV